MPLPRIGEYLVAEGLLTAAAVNRALGYQRSSAPRVKLGSILLTWDLVGEEQLLRALAALHRCEAVTGAMLAVAPVDVVRLLPAAHAIRLNAIPYALDKSRIRAAFVNPSDLRAIDEVSALTGHPCVPGVATELRLLQAQRRFYGRVIPFELRPPPGRASAGAPRLSSAVPTSAPPAAPISVPIGVGTAAPPEPGPIRVPELPIPAAPPAPRRPETGAGGAPGRPAEPDAGPRSLWLSSLPEPPQSESVAGMWSPASEPEPETNVPDLALAAVPEEFPRAILLIAEPDGSLVVWRARGLPPQAAPLRFSAAAPSVFAAVASSGTPHFGRLEPEHWPDSLARLFDGPPPCAVFPVHSGHGVSAVLYADRRGAPMRFEDTALLARAAARIATLLAREGGGTPR